MDRVTDTEPFDKIIEAYHFLLHDLEDDSSNDSSSSCNREPLRDQLARILDMAIRGAPVQQIEELLLQLGQHRPNQGFGYAPYPPFTGSRDTHEIVVADRWQEKEEEKVAGPETPTPPSFPR